MSGPWSVTVWHGEGGSLAYVVGPDDDCAGVFSTIRHGAAFRDKAHDLAERLNAEAKS